MRIAPTITLSDEERKELTKLARSKRTSVRLAQRARIVLLAASGLQTKAIAAQLSIDRVQVARWRERYVQSRLAGIERDLPRGAPPVKVDVGRLIELTTQSKPEAAPHWSTRSMAATLGISAASVSRHWRAKTQVQALERTQPGLALKKGRAQTMTYDYKRHGTTPLFAVMNVLDGTLIGQCQQRHTHVEWLKFLKQIDRETPKNKALHLIADNYATHKHPVV